MRSYEDTVPLDDTVVLDSPIIESGQLSNDMNTQVLDGCESAQQSDNQMDGVLEKDIVLDSEDEGENRNEAVNSVSKCSGTTGRISGKNGIGLLRQQQAPAGYFWRLNKSKKHVLRSLDSSISQRSGEESTATRTGLCNDYTFQEDRVAVDSVVSRSLEQKPVFIHPVIPECSNMERESLKEKLIEGKLPLRESKYMDTGKDINYDSKRVESPRVAESQDKALRFVEDYLSVCDLGSHKDIPTRKMDMIKSPPCLRSKGAQGLAMRLTVESTATKLTTFDWAKKQIGKAENASLRMYNGSVVGLGGDNYGCVSVNQESPNVELHDEIYSLQSEEKLPVTFSTPNNLDIVCLSSNDTEKVGLSAGMCIAPDSVEMEEELDAGLSRQNVEKAEDLRLTPDGLYVGLDTQMAAEAMEELVHSAPPGVDSSCFTHQGSNNILLESSNEVNNKSKSNVASQKAAFVDWKCKEKRSKTIKISTVEDKSFCSVAGKRYKSQRKTASQLQVGKNLMTKKAKADEFFNRKEKTTNRKSAAPSGIIMQPEEYGITERCSLKESQKLYCVRNRRPKETADGIKYDPPPKRQKISSSSHKSSLRKGVNEVETDAAKGKENFHLDVADKTHSDLDPWVYPKGKRTRPVTPHHEISSSNQSLAITAIDNNPKEYPLEEAVGRVAKLLVYNRRHKVSLGSSSNLAIDLSSSSTDSPVPGGKVKIPYESHAKKPSKQSGTLDDASINMKADLLSKGNSATLQVSEGSAKRRRLSSSPISRSPLLKELTRLGYTDSLPDFLPKNSRRRRANEKVCILFSQNLDTSTLKQQKKILARLGFSIASCAFDATHFVADRFVRTRNMLEAVALGKPVVTHLWLEGCEQAGYTIDVKNYILRDEKKEKEIGFNMHVSLTRATQLPLLKGRRVLITPNVKPGVDVINSLIKAVQGEVVQNIQDAKTKNGVLILSSVEDCTICLQYLQKGASIYDSELLLNGIVTQELEYERYRLFKDHKENKITGVRLNERVGED